MGEWVLVDGVPSTCANIGLYTGDELLGPLDAPVDLVISGPNFGRNTGTAFSVSSGTLGATMAGALSGVRGIAISFCHFKTHPPTLDGRTDAPPLTREEFQDMALLACRLSVRLCGELWDAWTTDADVQVYSLNVPIAHTLQRPEVHWTSVWHSQHGAYYVMPSQDEGPPQSTPSGIEPKDTLDEDPACAYLHFRPDLSKSMTPPGLQDGTDIWAITRGAISISRLLARFAEVPAMGRPAPLCT